MYIRKVLTVFLLTTFLIAACSTGSQNQTTPTTQAQPQTTSTQAAVSTSAPSPTIAATEAPATPESGGTATPAVELSPTVQPTQAILPSMEPTVAAPTETTAVTPTTSHNGGPTPINGGPTNTYRSQKTDISFSYPDAWNLSTNAQTKAHAGTQATEQVALVSPDQSGTILISVYQLSQVISNPQSSEVKQQIERIMRSLASQVNGSVVDSRKYSTGKLRGFEYVIERADGSKVYDIFTLFQGDRQYNIQLEASKQNQKRFRPVLMRVLKSLKVPDRSHPPTPESANVGTPGHYVSGQHNFRFDYPKNWEVSLAENTQNDTGRLETVQIDSPDGKASIFVKLTQLRKSVDTNADYKEAFKELKGEFRDNIILPHDGKMVYAKPYRQGKLRGFKFIFELTLNGEKVRDEQVHFLVGDKQYALELLCSKAAFKKYEKTFKQTVSSFKPGGGS